jgi:hypothetical protein
VASTALQPAKKSHPAVMIELLISERYLLRTLRGRSLRIRRSKALTAEIAEKGRRVRRENHEQVVRFRAGKFVALFAMMNSPRFKAESSSRPESYCSGAAGGS